MVKNQKLNKPIKNFKEGDEIKSESLEELTLKDILRVSISNEQVNNNILKLKKQYDEALEDIKLRFEDKVIKIKQGDDLLPTVMTLCFLQSSSPLSASPRN